MPNRIIRDGFVDSESVAGLSDWSHRVYSNLLVKVDDAGRIDGRLEILRSCLFPLGTPRRSEDFKQAVTEIVGQTLAILYEYDLRPYLQLTKWRRSGSAETSRCPWKDGSHEIQYVPLQTRDGLKDYVTTSIPDGVRTPSPPPTDGVRGELNTETETETKKDTPPHAGAREDLGARPEQRAMNWLLVNWPRLSRNRGQVQRFGELIVRVGFEQACKMAAEKLAQDQGMAYPFTAIHQDLDDQSKKRGSNAKPDAAGRRAQKRAGEYPENLKVPILGKVPNRR